MEPEVVKQEELPLMLQDGLRKVTVLGIPMFAVLAVACVALFVGKLPADVFRAFVVDVLMWGGGIFAGANALEHFAKALVARK